MTMTWNYPEGIPLEDSPDLSEVEVASAKPVGGPEEIAQQVKNCPTCQGAVARVAHAFRLHNKQPYWRLSLRCEAGHDTTFLFLCPWLRGAGDEHV